MIITDRIYGHIRIENPLIADLIKSAPLQRLKRISQDGATHFLEPALDGNRFEHCVGAWYLAHHFQRPIEEQVASLLHDVPHTAFSHVVDFVMGDHNQEYHDRFLHKVVLGSDIPAICERYGIDIQAVLQTGNYPLLSNRTPGLSFDRWDYFMRDAHMLGILPRATIRQIIGSAKVQDNQFYFDDVHIAGQLCIASIMVCQVDYVSPNAHGSWSLLAGALKVALKEGIITEEDLFTTDDTVWAKLKAAGHREISQYLDRLQPGTKFAYAPREEAEFYGPDKARYIDPLVRRDGSLAPVSQLVPGLAQYIAGFKATCRYIGVKPAA